jgi:polynucleotide 5'-hydroxyl-kinase GRC3/NOL9
VRPDLPHAWATAIRTVLRTASRTLVLGPVDSGKSTLCRLLLEQARGAGRSVAILDLDLGQKLIGPPACVTLGTVTRQGPVLRVNERRSLRICGLSKFPSRRVRW